MAMTSGVVGLADQLFRLACTSSGALAGVQALISLQGAHALCPVVD